MNAPISREQERSRYRSFLIWAGVVLLLALAVLAVTVEVKTSAKTAGAIPTSPVLERWLASARTIERELQQGDGHYSLVMKKAHVYANVLKDGKVIGRFRPETLSTSVRAEVSTFQIGRALGCGELFQPAVAMDLRGESLRNFRQQLALAKFPPHRTDERAALLEVLEAEPEVLHGVFKPIVPARATVYLPAERPKEAPNGGLNTNDEFARFLRHNEPQPGHKTVALAGRPLPASPLARQLSNILLVDALAGQWDRFSGHNLHLLLTATGPHFMAIDNGGANPIDDQGYLEKFTHWVTRFDPDTVERLSALDAFLQQGGEFCGFASENALKNALGFKDAKEWHAFKERVRRVSRHVSAIESGGRFEE